MSTTTTLIKNITVDIIGIITIWGLINNIENFSYNFYINSKYFSMNIYFKKYHLCMIGYLSSVYLIYKNIKL